MGTEVNRYRKTPKNEMSKKIKNTPTSVGAGGSAWYVYLLRCKDGSLYCGITNDLKARLKKHNDGTGAKYTRGRGPVELVWKKKMKTPTDARKKEAEIKKLKKSEKELLAVRYSF